jgi:hypothetical protein
MDWLSSILFVGGLWSLFPDSSPASVSPKLHNPKGGPVACEYPCGSNFAFFCPSDDQIATAFASGATALSDQALPTEAMWELKFGSRIPLRWVWNFAVVQALTYSATPNIFCLYKAVTQEGLEIQASSFLQGLGTTCTGGNCENQPYWYWYHLLPNSTVAAFMNAASPYAGCAVGQATCQFQMTWCPYTSGTLNLGPLTPCF